MAFNKFLLRRGTIIGGVLGILSIANGLKSDGAVFPRDTTFMRIMFILGDFSIILGSALAGFVIDKYIINKLVFKYPYLRSHKIGSIFLCLTGGILFFFPALVLGVYLGSLFGGFAGSGFGKYGILIGVPIGMALFIIVIPYIGALLGTFLGAFIESLVRGLLRLAKR
jgi:hypothetical protein